jgi:hypothetical protein
MKIDQAIAYVFQGRPTCGPMARDAMVTLAQFAREYRAVRIEEITASRSDYLRMTREIATLPIYLGIVAAMKRRVIFCRWLERKTKYERPEYGEANNAMLRHLRSLAR